MSVLVGYLLLVCAWIVVAERSLIGDKCSGELLHNQKASTRSASEDSFVVAYGGDAGVEISCITTHDLSPYKTVSTLVAGGPGTRYAVLKVTAEDGSDADFEVNIFGIGSHNRVKREDKPASKDDKAAIKDTVQDIGKIVKLLRSTADRLDDVEKLLRQVGGSLDRLSGSA